MSYVTPGIAEFKTQFVRDFPYATPLSAPGVTLATATAVIGGTQNGVTSLTITSPGAGYSTRPPPTVLIYGGGGFGALASSTVAGGMVNALTVLNPGYGYIPGQPPAVYISTGQGDNTNPKAVTDPDLVTAIMAAQAFNMTQALFGSQTAYTSAYNLLAAHYLCLQLQAAGTGLHGSADWLTTWKSVGNVSESFTIPDRILKSPYLSRLSKTSYGCQFLELVSPQIIANMATFHRYTTP